MVANDEPVETKPLKDIKQRKKKEIKIYSKEQKETSLLEMLNWVLQKLNRNEINNITDFKNVTKEELDEIDYNEDTQWETIIFPIYSKTKMIYSRRNIATNCYLAGTLRRMCAEIGFIFKGTARKKINKKTISYYTKYQIINDAN